MNVTIDATNLEWMNNGSTLWAARLDDLSGNSVVFSEGYTPVISNKLVKVTNATRPTGTLSYTGSGNGVTATVPLYGINNVVDTEDCVTGSLTRNIGSVDFSSLEWTEGEGTWTASVNGIKADTTNVMSSNGYEISVSGTNVTVTSSASPTGMFYYEKASASVSTEAAQTMAMTSGTNTFAQSDMGRRASFDLTYRGIDYTLALDSTHKYGFKHGSTGTVLTGASSQAVVAGSDMVVDVTRLVNGNITKINAITAWSDIVTGYPEYASYVAYNTGTVEGVQPSVKVTGKNLFDNAFFEPAVFTNRTNFNGFNQGLWKNKVSLSSLGLKAGDQIVYSVYIDSTQYTGTEYSFVSVWAYAADNSVVANYSDSAHKVAHGTTGRSYIAITIPNGCVSFGFGLNIPVTTSKGTVTATDAMLELGSVATAYEPYHDGGTAQAPAPLFAVGTAADSYEAVSGVTTRKMASYTFTGQESYWGTYGDAFTWWPPNKAYSNNVIMADYITVNAAITTQSTPNAIYGSITNGVVYFGNQGKTSSADFKQWIAGKTIYYELDEPTTSQSTPTQIPLQAGSNVAMQTDGGRTADFTLDYDGTDYSIATEESHKYITRINGVDDYITGGSDVDVVGKRDKLIDLTYMFGSGYEPATLAAFYHLFPTWQEYDIPYDGGSVLNFKGTGIVSVGFNLLNIEGRTSGVPQNTTNNNATVRGIFDETKYYVGLSAANYYGSGTYYVTAYSISDSSISVTSTLPGYGVAFPFRVIPGMTYNAEGCTNSIGRMAYYTYNGTYISNDLAESSQAPAGAYWGVLVIRSNASNGTSTWTNPCVHLQWSGTRNGDYEQYWSYTRPLPTLTYFPNGMNGIGTVADEISGKQAIQRLRMVNLADVEWTESDGTWVNQFNDIKADTPNIAATGHQAFTLSGQTVTFYAQPTGYLVYELSTPVVTAFQDAVNLSYQVSDYGTESIVPVNGTTLSTAPLTAIIQYQGDYARTITKLPENYQSQKSMDALLELLGQLHDGVFTSTFNSATQSYGYSFTPNN